MESDDGEQDEADPGYGTGHGHYPGELARNAFPGNADKVDMAYPAVRGGVAAP